jgi:Mg2+ and Co2+ transporter CorA
MMVRNDAFDMYDLVRETMNYTSVDQGEHFLCIGANWLHRRPTHQDVRARPRLVPPKHWSWLTLTSDCTVLSFHDAPDYETPPEGQDPDAWRAEELKNMRSNTLAVLLQLSRHGSERSILSIKAVRPHPKQDQTAATLTLGLRRASSVVDLDGVVSMEGSSNLFYYLFEDYTAAVPILKGTRKLLDDMTRKVLYGASRHRHPTADLIPHIHRLSKELRQLQHLFDSYRLLIRRITTPRSSDTSLSGVLQIYADITLSQSARNRFERLGDRLQLLMLNTIKDYLEESNALSKTYFNLTTQVDSEATARLTRATTLLAKLSVFFLPITFMTSYFSVSIDSMLEGYTNKTYWYSFAVIAGVSFLGLFFFSRVLMFFSETLEEWASTSSDLVRNVIGLLGIDVKREEDYDF